MSKSPSFQGSQIYYFYICSGFPGPVINENLQESSSNTALTFCPGPVDKEKKKNKATLIKQEVSIKSEGLDALAFLDAEIL